MSQDQLEVTVSLTNQKVQFTGVTSSNSDHPVLMDYYPPVGDGQGYTGLELLLMSFAGCSGTSVVCLLRRMRKNVSAFRVNAWGIRRDQPPTCFQKISLEFVVESADVEDADIQKAIRLSEESLCPVWAMLKGNVEIITGYKITTP